MCNDDINVCINVCNVCIINVWSNEILLLIILMCVCNVCVLLILLLLMCNENVCNVCVIM